MSEFYCNKCMYSTSRQANYNRHIQSIKHHKKVSLETITRNMELTRSHMDPNGSHMDPNGSHLDPTWIPIESNSNTNIIKNNFQNNITKSTNDTIKRAHICTYCNCSFSGANNLSRHKKICSTKKITEDAYETKFKEMQNKIESLEKESKHFQEENKYHKRLLDEAGGLVKKSVSALTYIVHNYDSAPTIEMLDVEDLEDLEENNKKLIEDVISAYKHKTLDKYLGDSIIKLYKKENPKDQSIWSTDTNRLTYLIKELMVNDSSSWIIDKKGIKTKEYLIDPLLGHIKSLIISYQQNSINLSTNTVEIEYTIEISKRILKLVADIDDGVVGNNLLKYISTHLFFSDKLLK